MFILKINTLTCPNCNGNLEIEDGLDTFYCKYCGSKIILSELSDAAYDAKVKIKNMEHKEKLKEKELEHERYKLESTKKDFKRTFIAFFSILGAILVMVLIIILIGNSGERKQEQKLQELVEEIMTDIKAENFSEAYIKAKLLYWDDSWSSDGVEKWDDIRYEILEQIEKAESEANGITSNDTAEVEEQDKKGFFSWFD